MSSFERKPLSHFFRHVKAQRKIYRFWVLTLFGDEQNAKSKGWTRAPNSFSFLTPLFLWGAVRVWFFSLAESAKRAYK
jgi:hypothetical protein